MGPAGDRARLMARRSGRRGKMGTTIQLSKKIGARIANRNCWAWMRNSQAHRLAGGCWWRGLVAGGVAAAGPLGL
jgi:hypothetical protein